MKFYSFILSALVLLNSLTASASICSKWAPPVEIGKAGNAISELSGMTASNAYPGRFYFHNDSGSLPHFYMTNGDFTQPKMISFSTYFAFDMEDIDVGPCGNRDCIYIADIGDNNFFRSSIKIIVIEEEKSFPEIVQPLEVLTLHYPDGPHNAEAFSVAPNGDLFIITKESKGIPGPASVYKISRADISTKKLTKVGELDIPFLSNAVSKKGKMITSFDFSNDGSSFVVLTYENAFEFNFNLSSEPLKPSKQMVVGVDYNQIDLKPLLQQEAITHMPFEDSVLYSTEAKKSGGSLPILKVACLKR